MDPHLLSHFALQSVGGVDPHVAWGSYISRISQDVLSDSLSGVCFGIESSLAFPSIEVLLMTLELRTAVQPVTVSQNLLIRFLCI